MDSLFIGLQWILPQHLLSRLVGFLAATELPWLKNVLISLFISSYNVNMDEAIEPDADAYASFNEFFTRELKEGARPIADINSYIVSPADGAISQLGNIKAGRIFQAKGQDFSAQELLASDEETAAKFSHGQFATIYLSPSDYHRVHMPISGTLKSTRYVKGDLFSVNQTTAENVPRLFARNERLVCIFETELGDVAVVLVGAMIVAGIETIWDGIVAPAKESSHKAYDLSIDNNRININAGDEMGRFMLGSTVVLLFEENKIDWLDSLQAGTTVQMGTAIANKEHN